jgi:hypothetical protein
MENKSNLILDASKLSPEETGKFRQDFFEDEITGVINFKETNTETGEWEIYKFGPMGEIVYFENSLGYSIKDGLNYKLVDGELVKWDGKIEEVSHNSGFNY